MNVDIHVGDCLGAMRGMGDGTVDAVVTDPPYGISYQSGWSKGGPRFDAIEGDGSPAIEFLPDAFRLLRHGGGLFVFCEWRHQEVFRKAIEAVGATVRSQCIWDRQLHGMGDLERSFAPCHDVAWFATKGEGFRFHGTRPQSVLRFDRVDAGKMVHPAEKPVALLRHIVSRLAAPGGVVLDPYAGSGSTGVAATLEGRGAILCEMVPEYAEIARKRVDAAANGKDWKRPEQPSLFGGQP